MKAGKVQLSGFYSECSHFYYQVFATQARKFTENNRLEDLAKVKGGFDYFDVFIFPRKESKPLLFVHFKGISNVKADVINKEIVK